MSFRRVLFTYALFSCLPGVIGLVNAQTAEEKIFTQIPEVVESALSESEPTKSEPAPAKPAQPAAAPGGPPPKWIWGGGNDRNYRATKEFTANAKSARLRATCDNGMTVYLNGQRVAESDNWETPVEVDVTKHLKAGSNEIKADLTNQGGPAAFILRLTLTGDDGKTQTVITDDSWQVVEILKDKSEGKPAKATIIANMGEGAWGTVFTGGGSSVSGKKGNSMFQLPPGFQVERLFTVPKEKLGSWVCIAFDNKGRLLASDQGNQGICRITLPAIGSKDPVKVEKLDLKMSAAQGMLYAFNSLYFSVNGGQGSGLYRARDTNNDDQYDEVVKLATFQGGGEHGPHGLVLSPDGKSIVVACGNHTRPMDKYDRTRIPTNFAEDHLLPRQWDANGHARGILAPGGWIAQTDPDGKTWEMLSVGYRNQYDIAYNGDGELFSYDSDMEWDVGTPWYRATRVTHSTSGSDFGWRSGTSNPPDYFVDSLPPLLDIGPGSPVGIAFGYGTKFPAKYQRALYICDWTFGTMYAIHMEPSGSTYKAVKEEFVSRTPLPLTDNAVGPDGALYFTVGGRGTQSELYRVTYIGKEPTDAVDTKQAASNELHQLRKQIEQYHLAGADGAKAIEFCTPLLSHPDRFIRYAARVALELQPTAKWQDRVLSSGDAEGIINGVVGLAHQADKSQQGKLIEALEKLDFAKLTPNQQLGCLRAMALTFARLGEPDKETAARLAKKYDPYFPATDWRINRSLAELLIYLESPTAATKIIAEMQKGPSEEQLESMEALLARNSGYGGNIAKMLANRVDQQKFAYAFALRNLKTGWTMDQRKFFFTWLNTEARTKSGGASFQGFINNLEKDAFDNLTDAERLAVEAFGLKKPFQVKELPKAKGPGKAYTVDEIVAGSAEKLKGRNFANGQKMFAAARCVICHRYNGEGGATGPDLTQAAGRFSAKDLTEAIIDPSKVISDQYRASTIETTTGKVYTGKIVAESKDAVTILLNPEDSTKVAEIKKSEIESTVPSAVSIMPKDLLNQLNADEAYDLLAYILSRGDKDHAMFKK